VPGRLLRSGAAVTPAYGTVSSGHDAILLGGRVAYERMIVCAVIFASIVQVWLSYRPVAKGHAFPSVFAYSGLALDGVTVAQNKPAVRMAAGIVLFKIFSLLVVSSEYHAGNRFASAVFPGQFQDRRRVMVLR
jgi:hypothetical protein